jgi:hypothetical protein
MTSGGFCSPDFSAGTPALGAQAKQKVTSTTIPNLKKYNRKNAPFH